MEVKQIESSSKISRKEPRARAARPHNNEAMILQLIFNTLAIAEKNVVGTDLEECSMKPLTGWQRFATRLSNLVSTR
jgi:hypothetical protein